MTIPRPTEAEFNAYVDGELGPEAQAAVERFLAAETDEARRIADYRMIGEGLHALFDPVLAEPIPERLTAATTRGRSPRVVWIARIAAAIALLAVGGTGGWALRQATAPGGDAGVRPAMVRHAIEAHRLYSVEVRHPVEVVADEEAHMSAWLSRRLGKPIKPPPLAGAGFQLVGGRLLPSDDKPAAQFMYENGNGQRLTLFFSVAAGGGDASYRYFQDGGTQVLFWFIDGFSCALTGEFERKDLMAFAREIYRQRGGEEGKGGQTSVW